MISLASVSCGNDRRQRRIVGDESEGVRQGTEGMIQSEPHEVEKRAPVWEKAGMEGRIDVITYLADVA
jgi:hypothetical protein